MRSIELESSTYSFNIIREGGSLLLACNNFQGTLRELEVLQQKAQGLTDQEVAHQLGISPSTVKNLLESLRTRNIVKSDGGEIRPTTISLVVRARSLELLNPISLLGLRHLDKIMRTRAPTPGVKFD